MNDPEQAMLELETFILVLEDICATNEEIEAAKLVLNSMRKVYG